MRNSKNNSKPLNAEARPDEFTTMCTWYYKLTTRYKKRLAHLNALVENAPVYKLDEHNWRTNLTEIDAIMKYYYHAQIKKAELDKIAEDMRAVEQDILYVMKFFGIPAFYPLTCQIPGVLEFELWADDHGAIYIRKTADLEPEVLPDNVIVIKTSFWKDEEED